VRHSLPPPADSEENEAARSEQDNDPPFYCDVDARVSARTQRALNLRGSKKTEIVHTRIPPLSLHGFVAFL
jgi:hypothetical protein